MLKGNDKEQKINQEKEGGGKTVGGEDNEVNDK